MLMANRKLMFLSLFLVGSNNNNKVYNPLSSQNINFDTLKTRCESFTLRCHAGLISSGGPDTVFR
jgi:hypothetical protein